MHNAALLKHQSINKSTHTTINISTCSLLLKEENGSIEGSVKSIQYKPSPVPAKWLKIPLTSLLNGLATLPILKWKNLYQRYILFEYDVKNGSNESESDEDIDEEINICIQKSDESSEASDSEVLRNPRVKRKAPVIT